MDIKQLKLSSGEEILASIIDWDQEEIVCRNALKLLTIPDPNTGNIYHTLRPWMLFQCSDENIITINPSHLIGIANPEEKIVNQYLDTVNYLIEKGIEEEDPFEQEKEDDLSIDDYLEMMAPDRKFH